jgi:hypothetical protein
MALIPTVSTGAAPVQIMVASASGNASALATRTTPAGNGLERLTRTAIVDEYIAAYRKHARAYVRRATQGIKDNRGERFIPANAVIANLYIC